MNRDTPAVSFDAFFEQKKRDCAALHALSPDEAQAAAEAILHPLQVDVGGTGPDSADAPIGRPE
jgi:hypothetical protein